jgi:hypothetical protein
MNLDQSTKLGFRFSSSLLALSFLWLAFWWLKLPPQVPLLYSRPYGESRLINSWGLWLLPLLLAAIILAGRKAAKSLAVPDRLLAQLIIWLTAAASLIIFIALIRTVLLIT